MRAPADVDEMLVLSRNESHRPDRVWARRVDVDGRRARWAVPAVREAGAPRDEARCSADVATVKDGVDQLLVRLTKQNRQSVVARPSPK
jgi:hypothetical protein